MPELPLINRPLLSLEVIGVSVIFASKKPPFEGRLAYLWLGYDPILRLKSMIVNYIDNAIVNYEQVYSVNKTRLSNRLTS